MVASLPGRNIAIKPTLTMTERRGKRRDYAYVPVQTQLQRILIYAGVTGKKILERLIRSSRKRSEPGHPPHTRGRKILKRFMRFNVRTDAAPWRVRIGAQALPEYDRAMQAVYALEFGGMSQLRRKRKGVVYRVWRYVRARPFVRVAREKLMAKIPDIIKRFRSRKKIKRSGSDRKRRRKVKS